MRLRMTPLYKFTLFLCLGLFSLLGNAQDVEWMSWDQAVERAQTDKNPKKIFIDVYTDWCGWCKKMDKDTFQHPDVAAYMADNFYMVKMDGEGKDPIEFKGQTYNFVPSGRKGYHEFAAALMQGRMSYPTTIFLDEKMNMLSPVPGYQKPEPFLNIARYFGDNIYLEKDWQSYSGQSK
ncbi:thioredoxin family protein [Maribacter sp. ANRC-HE7]|uniref:Thioredoxin family protein n=1 Tax=Maribacter aquimaris TaxID=2737171 RepID=A0ABR7V2X3_9FLAO|nr:thioredoxin family protein [Maribacter aquimaris]MBD0779128.1 thioredoxin family protein [Maribacter aquimaris]